MSATRPPAFDERFTTPIEASRRGAHRARPKPVSAGLPVIAGIAVVLLVIGGAYTLLSSNNGSSTPKNGAAVVGADGPAATSTKAATPAKTPSAGQSGGAATTTAEAPAGDGDVNKDITLKVLNSITVKGLAKKVQASIESDGWKVGQTGNSLNRNLAVTKIYYGKAVDKPTAEALEKDLGFGTV